MDKSARTFASLALGTLVFALVGTVFEPEEPKPAIKPAPAIHEPKPILAPPPAPAFEPAEYVAFSPELYRNVKDNEESLERLREIL